MGRVGGYGVGGNRDGLPGTADQHAVLRRRLEFLEEPASFFYEGERPLHAEDIADP